jgi:phosphoribosylamine--glycine ligase
MASAGYPGAYETGKAIGGIAEAESLGTVVFHAGTRAGAHGLETAGGRVLGVTASGDNLAAAIGGAYQGVEAIHFDGAHFRRDIGRKGLERYNEGNVGT